MSEEVLTKRVRVIKMGVTVDPTSRTQRIMDWIARNGGKIDMSCDGSITFSYTGATLKVKFEDFEKI
jgi:hypothetical protein